MVSIGNQQHCRVMQIGLVLPMAVIKHNPSVIIYQKKITGEVVNGNRTRYNTSI
jgi:hypothetical protein